MNGFVTKMGEAVVGPGRDAIWGGALLVGQVFDRFSIERQVVRVVGLEATDCGRHSSPASETAMQQSLELGLIRFSGHLSKGEYDVQTDGRHTAATSASPVHR
jgi:hypothetical protein